MRIRPLGDRAMLVDLGGHKPERPGSVVERVYMQLAAKSLAGVTDIVAGFESVAVHYDPAQVACGPGELPQHAVHAAIEQMLTSPEPLPSVERRRFDIPVCYDRSLAPDLDAVAHHAGVTADEVVALHTGGEYTVRMIGFLPGFPYLGGMDSRLTTPRRSSPRANVAAGSVAIGGSQTGIYPIASPGGWQIIGRTAARLFDVERDPPALLRMGDEIRFRAMTLAEFSRSGAP